MFCKINKPKSVRRERSKIFTHKVPCTCRITCGVDKQFRYNTSRVGQGKTSNANPKSNTPSPRRFNNYRAKAIHRTLGLYSTNNFSTWLLWIMACPTSNTPLPLEFRRHVRFLRILPAVILLLERDKLGIVSRNDNVYLWWVRCGSVLVNSFPSRRDKEQDDGR